MDPEDLVLKPLKQWSKLNLPSLCLWEYSLPKTPNKRLINTIPKVLEFIPQIHGNLCDVLKFCYIA